MTPGGRRSFASEEGGATSTERKSLELEIAYLKGKNKQLRAQSVMHAATKQWREETARQLQEERQRIRSPFPHAQICRKKCCPMC